MTTKESLNNVRETSAFALIELLVSICLLLACVHLRAADVPDYSSFIRTPPAPDTPRINGPDIFGVRPGSPFLYTIPATGDRPMTFSVENLPPGLRVDSANGQMTGELKRKGEYDVIFHAKNAKGEVEKKFRIVCGDKIALTPPIGWNPWNCWMDFADQKTILDAAQKIVSSGLINHGWMYVCMDDAWQGERAGKSHALQPNEKFPDLKALCDTIHRLGLKAGIYSSPWITAYSNHAGGSSDNPDGSWSKAMANDSYHRFGKYSFEQADADQCAAWGFDYFKYDWNPIDVPHVKAMSIALRKSGRDIVFGLSNAAPFDHAADWARWANCWRTTSDIFDSYDTPRDWWFFSVSEIGFSQDRWAPFAGPGHWNDLDMLVVGGYLSCNVRPMHPTHLTPDEQYSHITMWCMLSSQLMIGCDLDRLDPFVLNLLDNDEVLAINQDALGEEATRVATLGDIDVYLKNLEDGGKAVAFFNRGPQAETINFCKLGFIGISGPLHVRDLWRQKNLPDVTDPKDVFKVNIAAHSAELYKFTSAK
ncbi:MAG: glycoside hydrolase family 27 protein [Verrucomicrobiia bacterium]